MGARQAERLGQGGQTGRLQAQPAVGRPVEPIGRGWSEEVAAAATGRRSPGESHQLTRLHHDRAGDQRGGGALTRAALAPMVEGEADREHGDGRGGDVVDRDRVEGRVVIAALRAHHAAHGLEDRIEGRFGRQGTLLAEAGDRQGDHARVDRGERGIVDS